MRASVLLAFVLLIGCSGLVDGNGGNGDADPVAKAQRLWLTKALPVFAESCSIGCHDGTGTVSPTAPGFLAGDSDLGIRDTLLNFQPAEIDLNSPPKSHVLTKGSHDGPSLDVTQASDILEWVVAQKEAQGVETVIIGVTPFTATLCTAGLPAVPPDPPNPNCLVNSVKLDELGATGASIDFVVSNVSGATAISNLKLVPGAAGVFMDHPTFVTYPTTVDENRSGCQQDAAGATFCGDVLDRFSGVVKNLASGVPAETIGDGNGTFTDFVPTDLLSIQFNEISAFKP